MYSKSLNDLVFNEVIRQDMVWMLGSILFAFLWIIIHTRSLIISLVALIIMICSFPAAMVICEGVFSLTYMSGLHLMTGMIVVGVTLNNVLVSFDTWKQTSKLCPHIFENKLEKRMSFVLRRCIRGIFMTNTVTALAILGNAWNLVMPIRSLALFAGTLVVVVFFFTLMILPPTFVIFDKIEKACCNKNKNSDV